MAFDYSQRVFFLGCFCDCLNHEAHYDTLQHAFKKSESVLNAVSTLPLGSREFLSY